jgi:hypothetical protein
MSTPVLLSQSMSKALDASGNGTIQMGPLSAREVWSPQNVSVSVSTNTLEAFCKIYIGDTPLQRNFIDGTYSGSSGDGSSRVANSIVKSGQYVWAVWTGGDPLSMATLLVTGTKTV